MEYDRRVIHAIIRATFLIIIFDCPTSRFYRNNFYRKSKAKSKVTIKICDIDCYLIFSTVGYIQIYNHSCPAGNIHDACIRSNHNVRQSAVQLIYCRTLLMMVWILDPNTRSFS